STSTTVPTPIESSVPSTYRGVLHAVGYPSLMNVERIATVTDGTSNTLMVGEWDQNFWAYSYFCTCGMFAPELGVEIMPGFRSPHSGIYPFALVDGSVRAISKSVDPYILANMVTIAGGEPATAVD